MNRSTSIVDQSFARGRFLRKEVECERFRQLLLLLLLWSLLACSPRLATSSCTCCGDRHFNRGQNGSRLVRVLDVELQSSTAREQNGGEDGDHFGGQCFDACLLRQDAHGGPEHVQRRTAEERGCRWIHWGGVLLQNGLDLQRRGRVRVLSAGV